jgi:hypothetical protein
MRSTTRSCSSCCSETARLCALSLLLALGLVVGGRARADDWLASLPPCSTRPAPGDPQPSFELVYPRAGLPALVPAGQTLIARVRLPAPLTPPPGVQQPRALAGWRAELAGHALPLDAAMTDAEAARAQRHPLEVVDVRPDGSSTLLYRAAIPIPAWVAPGSYDLLLWAPGGSGRAPSALRVLAPGAPPRIAWAGPDATIRLADPSAAALPVDVWVRAADATAELAPAQRPDPAAAPQLDLRTAALALRVGSGLWVIGGCAAEREFFDAEVASALVRERRTRMTPPPEPRLGAGSFRTWQGRAHGWPARESVRVQRAGGGAEIEVAPAFGMAAELAFLVTAGASQPFDFAGIAPAARDFYPASEIAGAQLPARMVRLRVAAGRRARIAAAAAAGAGLAHALRVKPQPVSSGARVRLSLATTKPGTELAARSTAHGQVRVAWRLDSRHTSFGPAQVEHRFLPLGAQPVSALVIAQDGRVQRLRADVQVETARASGCSVASGSLGSPAAWLWPALWLIQRRGRPKRRRGLRPGIDCEAKPVLRGLTVTARTFLIAFLLLLLAGFGCAHETIPNTHVEDTAENREIIEFVERYRKAVEDRDIVTLLNMTSRFYFDDMGTPSGDDDIDFDGLKVALERMRKDVLAARYQISYRGLTYTPNDRVLVDLLYTGWFKVETQEGPQWRRRLEPHRIVLAREDGKLLIVSGM